jgi:O-antigen/teichoic acid export membrane protein
MFTITKNIRQLAILTNNNAIGAAASYFLTIYLANHLGAEGFGKYSYILVVSAISTIFINYSTDQTASTMAAKKIGVQHIFNLIMTVRIIFFVLSLVFVSIWFYSKPNIIYGVFCLNISSLNMGYLYEIKEKNTKYSFVYLLERISYIIIVLLALQLKGQHIGTIFFIYMIVTSASLFFQCVHFSSILKNYSIAKVEEIKQLLSKNFYLVIIALSSYVYGGISRIVIENKLGMEMLGIFSSGMQITSLITIFQAQVDRVWRLPIYNSLADKNMKEIKNQILNYVKTSTLPSVFFFVVVALFGAYLVRIFFNSSYAKLAEVLPYISFFFVLINLNSLSAILWIGLHALKEYLLISVVFSIVLLLVLYLIPVNCDLKVFILSILSVQALSIIYSFFRLSRKLNSHVQ